MRGNERTFVWETSSKELTSALPPENNCINPCQSLAEADFCAEPADNTVPLKPREPEPQDPFAQDMELVATARDRQAYTRIFRHFAPRLRAFCRRQMENDQQAMELVQETMLVIWNKAHLYDASRASTTTWIYRICRNLRFDMLRKQLHLKDEISADDLWPSLEAAGLVSTPGGLYHQVAADQVFRYYLKLPPAQQEIVRMLYLEEKSHQEVADELDIPLGTVKSRVRLAINRLKQLTDSHD